MEENIIIDSEAENPRLRIEARTHIGGREEQQDMAYYYVDRHRAFIVVCDGMGSTDEGGEAAEMTINSFRDSFKQFKQSGGGDVPEFLHKTMRTADKLVRKSFSDRATGTTVVAAYIHNRRIYWISVGDSRLYLVTDGCLEQQTRDHNYRLRLDERLAEGLITQEKYNSSLGKADALISYIGYGNVKLFDYTENGINLAPGSSVLLTTDGMFRVLDNDSIESIAADKKIGTAAKADRLLDATLHALDVSLQDNTTFVLVDIL